MENEILKKKQSHRQDKWRRRPPPGWTGFLGPGPGHPIHDVKERRQASSMPMNMRKFQGKVNNIFPTERLLTKICAIPDI
jgi:hypothetical protein